MELKLERVFKAEKNMEPLSNKTILEQAEKELLVPCNAAAKATPPKATRDAPEVLEPEEVADMLAALAQEPLKWRLFTELLLATSCRRGEIAGLPIHQNPGGNHMADLMVSVNPTPVLSASQRCATISVS